MFFIQRTGVMEHWSIGRRCIWNCSVDVRKKQCFPKVFSKIAIYPEAFCLLLLQYSTTPTLQQKDSYQLLSRGNPKPGNQDSDSFFLDWLSLWLIINQI